MVYGVDDEKLTHEAQFEFFEADLRKPLAFAVRVAKVGNGIWPEGRGCYIENLATKERKEVREENGVHVMDVQFDDETVDVITLDSGAGCNVWPKGRRSGKTSKLLPKKAGLRMVTVRPSRNSGRGKFVSVVFERTRVFTGRGEPRVLCGPHRKTEW